MKQTSITVVFIFIVIAFCSCLNKKEIKKAEAKPVKITKDSIYIVPIEELKDGAVKQDVTYVNGKYLLRTIVATRLRYSGLKETASFEYFLKDMNLTIIYDKTIQGNFNYIKNKKQRQFEKADKYMWNYYRIKGIKDKKANLIFDSVDLLNKVPTNIDNSPTDSITVTYSGPTVSPTDTGSYKPPKYYSSNTVPVTAAPFIPFSTALIDWKEVDRRNKRDLIIVSVIMGIPILLGIIATLKYKP